MDRRHWYEEHRHGKDHHYRDKNSYDNPGYHRDDIYRPDYIQKDYLRQNINVWNHKNVPQPYMSSYHYGETQRTGSDQLLHGSISSDSTSKSKSQKVIAIAIGIGLLIVVGGAIAVAVYFTSLSDVQTTTVSTITTTTPVLPQELKFQGNITIDNDWDEALTNHSSPVYKQKAANVSKMIDKVYQSSELKDIYLRNEVEGFRQGSTEAIIDIIFKNPAVVKEDVSTAAPPVVDLDNKKIADTFVESVQNGVVDEYNDVFDIDTNTVSFADITPPATTTSQTTTPTATTTPTTTTPTTTTPTTTTPTATITPTTTTPTTTTPTTTMRTTTTPTTTPTTTTPTTTTPTATITPTTTTPTTTTPTTTTPTTTTPTTTTPTTTIPTTTTPTTTTPTTTTPTTTTLTTTTPTTTTPTTTTPATTTPATTTTTTTPTTTMLTTTTTPTTTTTSPTTTTQTTTMTTVSIESLVVFYVQVLMRNMTWIPAYNDTGSAEYQNMLQTVNQMEANLKQQMLSMDSSPSMSEKSPIAEILYRLVFKGVRPLNGNVEIMFNLEFKSRYAEKSDGSQVMLDWLTIKDILSAGLKIDRDDCIITDLTPMTTTTAVKDSTPNTTTAMPNTTFLQPHNISSTTKSVNFSTPNTTTAMPNTTFWQTHNISSTTKSVNLSTPNTTTAMPNTTFWQPHNISTTTKSVNFSTPNTTTAMPNTTFWQPHNISTTTKSVNFSIPNTTTAMPNTTFSQPHNISTTTKSVNFSTPNTTTAMPNTTFWQPHNISTTTSSSVPNGTVIFFVQLLMINMTWSPAYNDTNSPEYQMLMLEIQQMEVQMQQYMSSMGNSTSMSSSMPVSQIYNGFRFHKISEYSGNVMIMFDLVFKARYAMMPDSSMMTMDSQMVENILSDVINVNPSHMHITDLMTVPQSTTPASAGGNTTTMAPPSNTTVTPVHTNFTTPWRPTNHTNFTTPWRPTNHTNFTTPWRPTNHTNFTTPWTPTTPLPEAICIEATSLYHDSLCKPFGFNLTSYPNYLGHQSEAEAAQFALLLLNSANCTGSLPAYVMMCSILSPSCEAGQVIPPCSEPCTSVALNCGLQNIPGLEDILPLCASFPSYYSGQQCIHYLDLIPSTPVPTISNTTTPGNDSYVEHHFASYGWIESPNYPNSYPNYARYDYSILSPLLLPITLQFVDFEVEASGSGCYDYVAIYDGSSPLDTRLAYYCGSSIPNPVTASSGEMYIEFYSDNIVTQRGFQAVFSDASIQTNFTTPWRPTGQTNFTTPWTPTTTSPGGTCGGYYTGLTGSFTSPNYPGSYPNSQNCYYYIVVPIGYTVVLTITDFITENCCDYVNVYDGLTNTDLLLVSLRGDLSTQRRVVESTANKMLVNFHSDGSVIYRGFRAIYTADFENCAIDHVQCSTNVTDCVSVYKLCNGYPDCANGFDEQHCLN